MSNNFRTLYQLVFIALVYTQASCFFKKKPTSKPQEQPVLSTIEEKSTGKSKKEKPTDKPKEQPEKPAGSPKEHPGPPPTATEKTRSRAKSIGEIDSELLKKLAQDFLKGISPDGKDEVEKEMPQIVALRRRTRAGSIRGRIASADILELSAGSPEVYRKKIDKIISKMSNNPSDEELEKTRNELLKALKKEKEIHAINKRLAARTGNVLRRLSYYAFGGIPEGSIKLINLQKNVQKLLEQIDDDFYLETEEQFDEFIDQKFIQPAQVLLIVQEASHILQKKVDQNGLSEEKKKSFEKDIKIFNRRAGKIKKYKFKKGPFAFLDYGSEKPLYQEAEAATQRIKKEFESLREKYVELSDQFFDLYWEYVITDKTTVYSVEQKERKFSYELIPAFGKLKKDLEDLESNLNKLSQKHKDFMKKIPDNSHLG